MFWPLIGFLSLIATLYVMWKNPLFGIPAVLGAIFLIMPDFTGQKEPWATLMVLTIPVAIIGLIVTIVRNGRQTGHYGPNHHFRDR